MNERRLPTMGDVARHAGVSPATVARVIYEPEKVSPEKRATVQAALEATGYRPNVVARGLRTQRSWTVGLIIVDGSLNPYFVHLSHAIRLEALARGYTTLTFQHGTSPESAAAAVAEMIQRRVDAVIFSYALRPEDIAPLTAADIPVIQIEQQVVEGTDAVLTDPNIGIDEAIGHLAGFGHRRIAFLGGDPQIYRRPPVRGTTMEDDRLAAYRQALHRHGAEADPALEILGRYFRVDGQDPASEGRAMADRALALPQPPTAILASSDILAAGVLQALGQRGLRVPDDMSLIGFDDSIASLLTPPLHSIGRPLAEMARAGIEQVIAAIEQPDHQPVIRVLPTGLRCRASTGPAKALP